MLLDLAAETFPELDLITAYRQYHYGERMRDVRKTLLDLEKH